MRKIRKKEEGKYEKMHFERNQKEKTKKVRYQQMTDNSQLQRIKERKKEKQKQKKANANKETYENCKRQKTNKHKEQERKK